MQAVFQQSSVLVWIRIILHGLTSETPRSKHTTHYGQNNYLICFLNMHYMWPHVYSLQFIL